MDSFNYEQELIDARNNEIYKDWLSEITDDDLIEEEEFFNPYEEKNDMEFFRKCFENKTSTTAPAA